MSSLHHWRLLADSGATVTLLPRCHVRSEQKTMARVIGGNDAAGGGCVCEGSGIV